MNRQIMSRQIWIGFLTMTLTLALAFIGLYRVNTATGREPDAPRFDKKGELVPPSVYRDWVHLTSGLNMSYSDNGKRTGPTGETDEPLPFINVFVRPLAYREFQRTGTWPDHTRFVIVIRASPTKVHPNQKWDYFRLMSDGTTTPSKTMSPDQFWNGHNKNGTQDNPFVQFYPTLKPIAEEKGNVQGVGGRTIVMPTRE